MLRRECVHTHTHRCLRLYVSAGAPAFRYTSILTSTVRRHNYQRLPPQHLTNDVHIAHARAADASMHWHRGTRAQSGCEDRASPPPLSRVLRAHSFLFVNSYTENKKKQKHKATSPLTSHYTRSSDARHTPTHATNPTHTHRQSDRERGWVGCSLFGCAP